MAASLIVIEGVNRRYVTASGPVDALRDVSLSVDAGEFCTIIGPSGCGKSTLLGMPRPHRGPGRGGPGSPHGGHGVPGSRPLSLAHVVENIEFGLELRGVGRAERRRTATELLGPLGLRGFAEKYPRELSGGMRQRVAIGRMLAIDTPNVLMDEPFGALDEQTRMLMGEWLLEIWRQMRKTVIFVTHSLHEALALSGRVVVMTARPGRIKSVLELPLPDPRAMESAEIVALRATLWHEIREESARAMVES